MVHSCTCTRYIEGFGAKTNLLLVMYTLTDISYFMINACFINLLSDNVSFTWRRHQYIWRVSNLDLCSVLTAIKLRRFFSGKRLWLGTSVFMASSGGPVALCCVPIGSGIVTSFSKTGISLPGFKLWLLACKVSALPLSQLRNILLFHLNNLRVLGYGSRATAPLVKFIHCIKWSILSFSHTINCLH